MCLAIWLVMYFFLLIRTAAIKTWVRGELLARGTFGNVYLALNAATGEMMAIKQVGTPDSDSRSLQRTSAVELLRREHEVLKDLDHPNIVQYLGYKERARSSSL